MITYKENAFQTLVFYYTSFFEAMREDSLLTCSQAELINRIASVFPLSEIERQQVSSVFNNEEFASLKTVEETRLHIDFISAFSVGAKLLFGKERFEMLALQQKLSALGNFENLKKSGFNFLSALELASGKSTRALTLKSMLYLLVDEHDSRVVKQLKKTCYKDDGTIDIEATMLLLASDIGTELQQKLIALLEKVTPLTVTLEELGRVKNKYFTMKGDAKFSDC
ncbi:MAG: hypothetical protein J6B34_01730 [Clostridia bacterium]|nr:hypothetical protein [Clostridia bacterium]